MFGNHMGCIRTSLNIYLDLGIVVFHPFIRGIDVFHHLHILDLGIVYSTIYIYGRILRIVLFAPFSLY